MDKEILKIFGYFEIYEFDINNTRDVYNLIECMWIEINKFQQENTQLKCVLKEIREYITNTPKIVESIYFDQKKKDVLPAISAFLNATFKNDILEIIDKVK